jgi:AcrR family transcriptional regulator
MTDVTARVGRPAQINRLMIARAAHELGLEGLTLRAVADHLGVSVAALYHYVSGKDDLVRAAAEYAAGTVPLPEDTGQHWAVWLLEWAFYNHDVFASRPRLLAEYLDGAISEASIAPRLDRIIGGLVRQGFTALDAAEAYRAVAASAMGVVVTELRSQQVPGDPPDPADELTHLRALRGELRRAGHRPFEDLIVTVIRGIAAERGDEWGPVHDELRRAIRRRRRLARA